jgi:purine-nucleoside phosphorylase
LKLLQFIVEQLKKDKVPHLLGGTWTTDAPYRETRQEIAKYRKEGIVTVDMEASAMYVVARKRQARAASLFVISDIVAGEKWKTAFTSKAVSDSLMKAFQIALKALGNPKI